MINVIAMAKISWNFDDADLSVMPMDEIKAKFKEEFEQEMKNSLQAEETSIETLEIRQEAN